MEFRVWDKITKTMYYPNTGVADHLYMSLEGSICSEDDELQDDGTHMRYIGYRMKPLLSTRVRDMNCKYIYDGDVLKVNEMHVDEGIYVVSFKEFQWVLKKEKYFSKKFSNRDLKMFTHYSNVIGNIYEQPEYLEMVEKEC